MKFELFAHNIKLIRSSKGVTAEQLSIKLGLKPKRISDIETGRGMPDLDEVALICNGLGQKIDDMLYRIAHASIYFE
jgi:transcriptional regulator with XRE-family HTH domain